MLACGVCGTDVRKISPGALSESAILGHEVVGEVVESKAPERFKPGDRLATSHHVPCFQCHYCRHGNYSMCSKFKKSGLDPGGFSEFVRIPRPHVNYLARRIPDSVSNEEAVFMEPIACCLRAIHRCGVMPWDRTLVVGLGSVGLIFGLLLEQKGGKTWGLDLLEERAQRAMNFGYERTFSRWDETAEKEIREASEAKGFDAVIVCAGTPALLTQLKTSLRDGGTLCLFGGADPKAVVELPWNEIYKRELILTSSYSPSLQDLNNAFTLICGGMMKNRDLPVKKYSLEQISQAVQDVKTLTTLKAVVTP
jgi:L-iditol 2-dehydrogenase